MTEYEFHETANAFPFISGEAYETLKRDIEKNGILEPVYIYDGKIIDGRNRYRIAIDLGLTDIPTQEYQGDNPVGFVQSMNLHRRQLSPSQKAAAAAFLADFKQGHHHDDESYETQASLAKKLGISRRMVVEATSLKKHAGEKLIERVRNGEISLHNATALAKLTESEQESVTESGTENIKIVAKKIKAMTLGKGRKKKGDPDRAIDLESVNSFALPEKSNNNNVDDLSENESIFTSAQDNEKHPINGRKPRIKKKIEMTEATNFGHSLIDAIIVLGTTAEDVNGGDTVISTALSKSQLEVYADEYDPSELRALLSAGIHALEMLVK